MLDECFVGLIFSTFNHDAVSKEGRVQVGARNLDAGTDRMHMLTPVLLQTYMCHVGCAM